MTKNLIRMIVGSLFMLAVTSVFFFYPIIVFAIALVILSLVFSWIAGYIMVALFEKYRKRK